MYDFGLPDRMTCTTAFGFSAAQVFRYHGLKTEEPKRRCWRNTGRTSPPIISRLTIPRRSIPSASNGPICARPKSTWRHGSTWRIVTNETHTGQGAFLIYDDKPDDNVTVTMNR